MSAKQKKKKTVLPKDSAAIVFPPDGSLEILFPADLGEDEVIPMHVLAAVSLASFLDTPEGVQVLKRAVELFMAKEDSQCPD
jgi:hypothetical protein